MANLNNNNLKLGIQKQGRLTDETLEFLRKAGLEFESYKQRLFSTCRNFPAEIYFLRSNDIPFFVAQGLIDFGVIGQNTINEKGTKVKNILKLNFGYCSLVVAVPKKSEIKNIENLRNKTIATTYPKSTINFFIKNNIPVNISQVSGSVEIAPALGMAEAITDLTSTGKTLKQNDLIPLAKIYDSEAVLIANNNCFVNGKKNLANLLIQKFRKQL
jgi:ATP phosphoribosyltransferase